MKISTLALMLAAALTALAPLHAQEQKPTPTVEFAASWDDALVEAAALGVPIVVHVHGFY